jgi:hypothetical protein
VRCSAVTCTAGFAMGVTLVAFFVSSSLLTRVGGDFKRKTEEDFKCAPPRACVRERERKREREREAALAAAGGIPNHGRSVPRHIQQRVLARPLTRTSPGGTAE